MDQKLKIQIKKFTSTILNNDVVNLTLTYKQKMFINGVWIDLDRNIMEQNLKHFLNLINSKVFGNGFRRYKKHKCRCFN